MPTPDEAITQILQRVSAGDERAAAELLPIMYDELRALARARFANIPAGQTLQPTALVHEAYLKLVGRKDASWSGRGHFFGAAASAMRDILVDQARRKARVKHGGDRQRIDLQENTPAIEPPTENLLALNDAIERLKATDERKGRIVMLRYFAGLTVEETAEVLGVSVGTIEREWRFIRVWLYDELTTDASETRDA